MVLGASAGRGSWEEGPSKVKKRTPSFPSLNPCLLNSYPMPGTAAFTEFTVSWGEHISTFSVASDRNQFKLDSTKGNLLAHLIEKSVGRMGFRLVDPGAQNVSGSQSLPTLTLLSSGFPPFSGSFSPCGGMMAAPRSRFSS